MKTIVTASVKSAAKFIKEGEVVGFPTETVYGLGANVFDEQAVKKIFKAKNRPADNPLITHISKIEQLYLLVEEVPKSAEKIIKKFFPGPITVVLKKNEIISEFVSAGLDTIGIRMPDLEITKKFIDKCGVPVCAPSANVSGSPSPTSWKHVLNDMDGKIPCILKGPHSKIGIESTVIDCTEKIPVILRHGSISLDELKKVFPDIKVSNHSADEKIKSPGVKYRHYAPKAKVVIVSSQDELNKFLETSGRDNSAFIGLMKISRIKKKRLVKDASEYAKTLFNFFRSADDEMIKFIYCQAVKEKGIGLALMNRLRKAALEI